ncbi:uncharacterized protein EI90DRAFT_3134361 [Cantharellus anzutake]|uniref:uncharacterized protein n=1 Tax=Cantharellus anzutake TaxID=1750568 RepID=UPI0019056AD6|nr:uncharacterized protein EI90DRAFT_3134361 [Cantharellus anzutake]KAF8316524.1 hypothetical protein EI90DRAFT_3134361 [Cantharellus anzutake]
MSNYSQVSDWSDAHLEDDSGDNDHLVVIKLMEHRHRRAAAKAAEEREREEAEEARRATEALKKRRKEEAVARKRKSIAMSTLSTSDWPPACARCLKCHIELSGQGRSPRDEIATTHSRYLSHRVPHAGTSPLSELSLTVGWLAAISEQLRVHNTMMGSALASRSRRESSNLAVDKAVMGDEEPKVGRRQAMVPQKEVGDEEPEEVDCTSCNCFDAANGLPSTADASSIKS